ncbi:MULTISPECIES: ABC transporter ATP-binding protein [unclassified Janibacter]|uniref:ABC transporter ATP-binding protein n=1 Tax=unclassified Janibacter TaxID=2649294 RepID=UPI003D0802EB
MSDSSASTLRRSLRIIALGVRQRPGSFALSVFGSVLYGVATTMSAWAVGHVTRAYVEPAARSGEASTASVFAVLGIVGLVVLLTTIGVLFRRIAGAMTTFGVAADYRRRVTRQYLRLPLSWHHRHPSGQLLSNANADVEATWNVFMPLPMALGVIVMLITGLVQMVLVDWTMALIGLALFPALLAANAVFQRIMSPRVTRAQQLRADVSEVAHESLEAALVVKSMGREEHETARFAEVSDRLREANVLVGRTRGTFDPVIEAIPTLGTLAMLGIGVQRVASGSLEAADVVQMAYLISVLAFPVRALGWVLGELPRTVVGWDRVEAVLLAKGAMTHGDAVLARESLDLRFDDVSYEYEARPVEGVTARTAALTDVSFTVRPGSTVALVGPTGSGKSTLASLAVRLIDPTSGVVAMGGTDLRDLRPGQVSGAAALVPQQTFLFDDSVRDNITLGEEIPEDRIRRALAVAGADGFVGRLPDGIDTMVGERGASLSGGQRQRIALARALVREPEILVLDDATSAVDPSVEQAILGRLRESSADTTVLVIAYRLSTIALADEILYLEGGRLLDRGTHAELLARSPGYERLVTAYARDAQQRADDLAAELGDDAIRTTGREVAP